MSPRYRIFVPSRHSRYPNVTRENIGMTSCLTTFLAQHDIQKKYCYYVSETMHADI